MEWREYIVTVPGVRSGQPLLSGTRITVKDVLGNLAAGMSPAEIVEEFPPLTTDQVLACLSYSEALLDRLRSNAPLIV